MTPLGAVDPWGKLCERPQDQLLGERVSQDQLADMGGITGPFNGFESVSKGGYRIQDYVRISCLV